jgi:hypothetical protein
LGDGSLNKLTAGGKDLAHFKKLDNAVLAANIASVLPINWVSGSVGAEDYPSWDTKDKASLAAGTAGLGANLANNLAQRTADAARANAALSPAKQFLGKVNTYRELLRAEAAERAAETWKERGKKLEVLGKGLAAASLAIDLWNCYKDCEKDPCAYRFTYAEKLGELISKYYD